QRHERAGRRGRRGRQHAKEVLEATRRLVVRVAFHVEEDVPRRLQRQQAKTCSLVEAKHIEAMPAAAPMAVLQRCLMPEPVECHGADADAARGLSGTELRYA